MSNIAYVFAASKANLTKSLEGIADSVANANTTGYKAEKDLFREKVLEVDTGERITFPEHAASHRDMSQGPVISTGRPLDAAIRGDGYFMVETPLGQRFTRGGNFRIDTNGTLVTKEGYQLVGPGGGAVEFSETDTNISIKQDGLVTADGEERGQIGVFVFENEQLLERTGEGLYRSPVEDPQPAENFEVVQGATEGSNVNSVIAMTHLIEVSRSIDRVKRLEKDQHDLIRNMIKKLSIS